MSGTWANAFLDIGLFGTGTVTIKNGGVVTASSASIGLSKGSGRALVKLDGGTLRATQNNNNYFSNLASGDVTMASGGVTFDTDGYNIGVSTSLSGTGRLTKTGSGALTFSGIIGFDANAFVIDTQSFRSTFGNFGVFSVGMSLDGKDLELNYTVIPEPGTWSLAIGGSLLAFVFSRRKRI